MKQIPLILLALSIVIAATSVGVFYYSTQPSETDLAVSAPVVSVPETTETADADADEPEEQEAPQDEASSAPEVVTAQAETASTGTTGMTEETSSETSSETSPETSPETSQAQSPTPEARADAEVERGINLARIRPDGTAVIAGIAPPGSTVTLMLGDKAIGSAVANDLGEWVVVPDMLLEKGSHLITATVTLPDGATEVEAMALVIEITSSDETPLVALVPYAVEEAPVLVLQAPDSAEVSTIAEADTAMETEDATPMVAMAPKVTIRSVQAFSPGYLSVGGRAEGGASVQLSINDAATAMQPLDGSGIYQLGQQIETDAETAMLKVTLHDGNGDVLASARLKLSRGQIETSLSSNTLVVVQKGDALWRIAYQTYGKGIRYVDIYRQNSSIIRDPDLIYPDQIFVVPNS